MLSTETSTETSTRQTRGELLSDLHIKVPAVILFFWIIKVLATTVGETFADFINTNFHLGLTNTSILITALTIVALIFQFRAPHYIAAYYWLVVILISVAGTLITDNLTDNFGVPLQTTTIIFAVCLAITFFVWHRVEGTLSIHSIRTKRREVFYWLTILLTFALGTASGDLVNEKYALGYRNGLLLFGGLILIIAVANLYDLNSIFAFWAAYVLTRPLGASLGDLLTQPKVAEDGGFPGLGYVKYLVNGAFLFLIIGLVIYLTISKIDRITPEKFADATD